MVQAITSNGACYDEECLERERFLCTKQMMDRKEKSWGESLEDALIHLGFGDLASKTSRKNFNEALHLGKLFMMLNEVAPVHNLEHDVVNEEEV